MGEHRVEMQANPRDVEETLTFLRAQPEASQKRLLRTVVEAISTFNTTGDSAILKQVAEDFVATMHFRALPGVAAAIDAAPKRPLGQVRSVDEVYARLSS